MAILQEFTPKEAKAWAKWVKGRPALVRDLCERFPPNRLYLLKSTGQRVTIASYSENGTLRVDVSADFNKLLFERSVFGISPDDLEECDLPGSDEPLGAALAPEDVDANIDFLRCAIRPDLFAMGPDGKAIRKS